MPEPLYHPKHVVAAIESVEHLDDNGLKALLDVKGTRSPGFVASEAIVRLLRRAQVETPRNMPRERILVSALMLRVKSYSNAQYSGLSSHDRDDLTQSLLAAIFAKVRQSCLIDYWEITFRKCLDRAAADAYQEYFRTARQEEADKGEEKSEDVGDDGSASEQIEDAALLTALTGKILSPAEQRVFPALFTNGIPICSSRASIDAVRLTGIPDGTLREMKTNISRKLQSHVTEKSQ